MKPKYNRILLKLSGEALPEKKNQGLIIPLSTKYVRVLKNALIWE